jgi:hypothetical protein
LTTSDGQSHPEPVTSPQIAASAYIKAGLIFGNFSRKAFLYISYDPKVNTLSKKGIVLYHTSRLCKRRIFEDMKIIIYRSS